MLILINDEWKLSAKRLAEQNAEKEGKNESSIGCCEKNGRNERWWRCRLHCTGTAVIAGFRASASTAGTSSKPWPHRTRSDVWRKLVEPQTGEGREWVRCNRRQSPPLVAPRTSHWIVPGRRLRREALYKLSLIALAETLPQPISRLLRQYGCAVRPLPPTFRLSSPRSPPALVIFSCKRPYHFPALPACCFAPLRRTISASATCTDNRCRKFF